MGVWKIKIVERRVVVEEFPLDYPTGSIPPEDLEYGGRLFARIAYKSQNDGGNGNGGQAAYKEVHNV